MGLIDEEYGWPKKIEAENIKTLENLSPGHRCHPFVFRGPVCIAVSIMIGEYELIRKRLLGEPPSDAGSEEESC